MALIAGLLWIAAGDLYWRALIRRASSPDELALAAADGTSGELSAILAAVTIRAAVMLAWPLLMAWGWANARCN